MLRSDIIMAKGGMEMAKVKGKRVMAKLTGMRSTTVWLTKEQQDMVKKYNVSNQEFAQHVFDVTMGFIVNVSLKDGSRKTIDPTGIKPTEADRAELAKLLGAEIVRNLKKEGKAE